MVIECVWEHNGNDTLLHAVHFPGAYTRGASKEIALRKMPGEVRSYLLWKGAEIPKDMAVTIVQESSSELPIKDADNHGMGGGEGGFRSFVSRHDDRSVIYDYVFKQNVQPDHNNIQSAKYKDFFIYLPNAFSFNPLKKARYGKYKSRKYRQYTRPIGNGVPKKIHSEKIMHRFINVCEPYRGPLRSDGGNIDTSDRYDQ
jgi:hypothetical protein